MRFQLAPFLLLIFIIYFSFLCVGLGYQSYGQTQAFQAPEREESASDAKCGKLMIDEQYMTWKGRLGEPLSEMTQTPDGLGYYQNFTNGAIYFKNETGAFVVFGEWFEKWNELGGETGKLGYPLHNLKTTLNRDGEFVEFENGAIYSTPNTGIHEVHGSQFYKWDEMGRELSSLGYPITGVQPFRPRGGIVYFEGGSIRWTEKNGIDAVHSKDFTDYFNFNNLKLPQLNETMPNQRIHNDLVLETVFQGLEFPTSMAFLGPDDILVLEKNTGKVQRIVNGTLLSEPLLDVDVAGRSESGMLGIAVSEDTSDPRYVFLYFTEAKIRDLNNVCDHYATSIDQVIGEKLYRYELSENRTRLTNPKLLLSIPDTGKFDHKGGKMLIGPDQNIYLIVGDHSSPYATTQNNMSGSMSNGSSVIYRINQDGEPVQGNPFYNVTGDPLVNKIYAYGIRNGFGIDFDPETVKLWDTENGHSYYDEINLVEPGFNSGWIKIQGLAKHAGPASKSGLVNSISNQSQQLGLYSDPEFVWNITVGVTAIKFLDTNKLGAEFRNDLIVGDFNNQKIYLFELNNNRTSLLLDGLLADRIANNTRELEKHIIVEGFGSITDFQISPDGYAYVSVVRKSYPTPDEEGTIYKIVPKAGIS